jgi:hypothetical protein
MGIWKEEKRERREGVTETPYSREEVILVFYPFHTFPTYPKQLENKIK